MKLGCAMVGYQAGADPEVAASAAIARGMRLRPGTTAADGTVHLCAGHVLQLTRAS